MTDTATTNGHHPDLTPLVESLLGEVESLREQYDSAMLELAMEDAEWRQLTAQAGTEFSRAGILKAAELARLMALKNPLVKRGLAVQGFYVFGQGVGIRAKDPLLQPIIGAFVGRNRDQLFGLQIQLVRDRELACDGNLFLALFTDQLSGAVTIRPVPLGEITDIITDPEDRATTLYYLRSWTEAKLNNQTGTVEETPRSAYYPDWRYRPASRPKKIGDKEVRWNSPIYHIAVGAFSNWLFGLSEVYAAIDWARAYKNFLEDWATITRALSRFAWKRATRGTRKAVQSAARQMATTLGTGGMGETNPPPTVGAVAVMGQGEDLEPMKTAGATTKMEDGRRLSLMVAAAQDLPETFYGDASVGTLATARSLDRPTELKMAARQQLWAECFDDLCAFQLLASARAARGEVRKQAYGQILRLDATTEIVVWAKNWDESTGEARLIEAVIEQDWPPVVEPNIKEEIESAMLAAPAIPDARFVVRLLLKALRIPDADTLLAEWFPEGDPNAKPKPSRPTDTGDDTDDDAGDRGGASD